MYVCKICNREFSNYRSLNGHSIAHKEGQRYRVSRKKTEIKIYNCLNCDSKFEHKGSTYNLYCSQSCSTDHKWKTI